MCFRKKDKQLDRLPSHRNNHWEYIHSQHPQHNFNTAAYCSLPVNASLTSTSHTINHSIYYDLQQPNRRPKTTVRPKTRSYKKQHTPIMTACKRLDQLHDSQ
jgi:hypothetical protein